jgi:hypothetical protein
MLAATATYQKKYCGIPGITVLFHGIYRRQNFEYRPTLLETAFQRHFNDFICRCHGRY